jgi:hypothetical protein
MEPKILKFKIKTDKIVLINKIKVLMVILKMIRINMKMIK